MRIKLSQIRRIIREETAKKRKETWDYLDTDVGTKKVVKEAVPFRGVAPVSKQRSLSPKSRAEVDPMDAPDPGQIQPAHLLGSEHADAARALDVALKALSAFNPKWHSLVCRSRQGKEMSSVVIDLEKSLKQLTRELHESKKLSADELRMMIFQEARAMGLAEATPFRSVTSMGSARSVSRKAGRHDSRYEDTEAAQSSQSPAVQQAQKLISDWLFLHGSFTPKFRRSMCLGKAGDNLALALQTLDDMLGKL